LPTRQRSIKKRDAATRNRNRPRPGQPFAKLEYRRCRGSRL
jgi:hypothetical protein